MSLFGQSVFGSGQQPASSGFGAQAATGGLTNPNKVGREQGILGRGQ